MANAFTYSAPVSSDNTGTDLFTDRLMNFLDSSPVSFLAAHTITQQLSAAGFSPLREEDAWELLPGRRYYVTRNDSAVIAFCLPSSCDKATSVAPSSISETEDGRAKASGVPVPPAFHIVASHLDSPTFRIKSNAEITVENKYITLNVEKYGGMILSTWLDRPLSAAGRVLIRTENGIASRLVNIDRDLMIIPSVAIHMNRTVNDGYKWDMKQDLRPLFSGLQPAFCRDESSPAAAAQGETFSAAGENAAPAAHAAASLFRQLVAKEAGVAPEDIIDTDLYLYNRQKSVRTGLNREFISSGRLDDLQCAYSSLAGFLSACGDSSPETASMHSAPTCDLNSPMDSSCIPVFCAFDNEEVGSMTRQGADSSLLRDTLHRIGEKLGWSQEDFCRSVAGSFMISADNAHAVHPNHPELEDLTHRPVPNGGIVIKYSANQKYTTDAVSGAIMQELCRAAGVPAQVFYNRSDLLGGSTLGNISGTQLSIRTADIGLPQLAMHSAYETAGVLDGEYLARVCRLFYQGLLPSSQPLSFQYR